MSIVAFTIFGVSVHWYGIMIALGILFAVLLAFYVFRFRDLNKDHIFELLLWMLPPAIIGARLYYLIFNGGPWGWEAFKIWNGGLAVYGSIIGGAIGAILFCVVRKINFLRVADAVVPSLALGQAFGRIGCCFGGCCYGVETTDPNLMHFPFSLNIDGTWHLATNLYESFFDFLICLALVLMIRKIGIKGIIMGAYFVLYGVLRAVLESFRDASEALFIGSVKVSLLLSILLAVMGATIIIIEIIRTKQKKRIS